MSFIHTVRYRQQFLPGDVNFLDQLPEESDQNADWWLRQAIMYVYGRAESPSAVYSLVLFAFSGHTKAILEQIDKKHAGMLFALYISAMESAEYDENRKIQDEQLLAHTVTGTDAERFRIYNERIQNYFKKSGVYVDANGQILPHRWLFNLALTITRQPTHVSGAKISELESKRLAMYQPIYRLIALKKQVMQGHRDKEAKLISVVTFLESHFDILGITRMDADGKLKPILEKLQRINTADELAKIEDALFKLLRSTTFDDELKGLESNPLYSQVDFELLRSARTQEEIKKVYLEQAGKVGSIFPFGEHLLWDYKQLFPALALIQNEFCRMLEAKATQNSVNDNILKVWRSVGPNDFVSALKYKTPNELITTTSASITTGMGNRGIVGHLCETIDGYFKSNGYDSQCYRKLPRRLKQKLRLFDCLDSSSITTNTSKKTRITKKNALVYILYEYTNRVYEQIAMMVSFRKNLIQQFCRIVPIRSEREMTALTTGLAKYSSSNIPVRRTTSTTPRTGQPTYESLKFVSLEEPDNGWRDWIKDFNVFINDITPDVRLSTWSAIIQYCDIFEGLIDALKTLIKFLAECLESSKEILSQIAEDFNWQVHLKELKDDCSTAQLMQHELRELLKHNPNDEQMILRATPSPSRQI